MSQQINREYNMGQSWDQVRAKIDLSWDGVVKLFIALQEPKSMTALKELYQWSNTIKFRAKYVCRHDFPDKRPVQTKETFLRTVVKYYSPTWLVIQIQINNSRSRTVDRYMLFLLFELFSSQQDFVLTTTRTTWTTGTTHGPKTDSDRCNKACAAGGWSCFF